MKTVWDPLQRLLHWILVIAVAIAWLTTERNEAWHEWVGYIALGLIGFRLIWGFIGPRYARFTQFIRGPQEVFAYTNDTLNKREKRYIGHNPLGALMVIALLGTTAAAGFSGWLLAEPERMAMLPQMPTLVSPALADSDGSEGFEYGEGQIEVLGDAHEIIANLLLLLIFLHVAGVMYASRRHNENLALSMITGKKLAPASDDIS